MNSDFSLDSDGLDGLTALANGMESASQQPVVLAANTISRSEPEKYTTSFASRIILSLAAFAVFSFFSYRAIHDTGVSDRLSSDRLSGKSAPLEHAGTGAVIENSRPRGQRPENSRPAANNSTAAQINSSDRRIQITTKPEFATSTSGVKSIASTKTEKAKFPARVREIQFPVLFGFGSSRITGLAADQMEKTINFINSCRSRIEFIGLTDSSGPEEYNRILGTARATAVRNRLHDHIRTDLQLSVSTRGSADPLNHNRNSAERAKNRRVLIRCSI